MRLRRLTSKSNSQPLPKAPKAFLFRSLLVEARVTHRNVALGPYLPGNYLGLSANQYRIAGAWGLRGSVSSTFR